MATGLSDRIGRLGEAARARKERSIDRLLGTFRDIGGKIFQAGEAQKQRQFLAGESQLDRTLSRELPSIQTGAEQEQFFERIKRMHGEPGDPSGVRGYLAHQLALRREGTQREEDQFNVDYWSGIAASEKRPDLWADLTAPGAVDALVEVMASAIDPNSPDLPALKARWRSFLSLAAEQEEAAAIDTTDQAGRIPRFQPDVSEAERPLMDAVKNLLGRVGREEGDQRLVGELERIGISLTAPGQLSARRLSAAQERLNQLSSLIERRGIPSVEDDLIAQFEIQEGNIANIDDPNLQARMADARRQIDAGSIDMEQLNVLLNDIQAHLQSKLGDIRSQLQVPASP